MTHPLYRSKNGAILWEELPEALRLYDSAPAPGDLQRYLDGFGHLMDRFEATLEQFHADGFAARLGPRDSLPPMQPWVLPYVAELFGVTLLGPDPESRAAELADAIWIARRRGSRMAVDRAAEAILRRAVVTVPGLARVLFRPGLKARLLTHEELTGQTHPLDTLILHEPFVQPATLSALRRRPAGLPLGLRNVGLPMRAVETGALALGSELRPVRDPATGIQTSHRFVINNPEGAPCFPFSFEDRALRRPDIHAPRANRPASAGLSRPDLVWLHVDPPEGIFRFGLVVRVALPQVADGVVVRPTGAPPVADLFFRPNGAPQLVLDGTNAETSSGRHHLVGLKYDGEVVIAAGREVVLQDCAIRRVTQRANSRLRLVNCLLQDYTAEAAIARCEMEYVTVTGTAALRTAFASDCIFAATTFPGAAPVGGTCLRYSRLGPGPALPTWLRVQKCTQGPVPWLLWPCLPKSGGGRTLRVPVFGEPGYGVLSDSAPPELAGGGEDGGEPGVYHAAFHLARLDAARRRAESFAPAGHRIVTRYDQRLAAPLPEVKTT